jgi:cellulose synthase operon protein C
MASLCDDVELFVDEELPPERAEAFRNHLPDCARCQREVANLLQLDMLGQSHLEHAEAQAPAEPPRLAPSARWRHPALLVAVPLMVVLVALAVVPRPGAPAAPESDVWLDQLPRRPLQARLSHRKADRHRPPPSKSMGASEPSKEPSLKDLALLEQSDPQGLVAAWLVHGDPKRAEGVLRGLEEQGPSADLANYRAVLSMLEDKPGEALRHLTRALEQDPRHPQARWNLGLALDMLDLPLLAARAFDEVAALGEPGWTEEAAQRAEELRRPVSERRKRWESVFKAGRALVDGAPGPLPAEFRQIPIARLFFYDAIRAAPTRERVLALLPLAQELDAQAGGKVLEGYVRRVAEANFSQRAPLAREYAALARDNFKQEEPRQVRLREALLASREDDLLLGTLFQMRPMERHLALFEQKAAASGDPWFQLLAAQERAAAERTAGGWSRATQILLEARRSCPERGLAYRCISLDRDLSGLYIQLHRFDSAAEHARSGLKQARDHGEWFLERDLLWQLAQIARFVSDAPLARARYAELLERDREDADTVRRVHQHLADIEWNELRLDEARREIDAALATGKPLSLSGAFTLSDIARLKSAPEDERHLSQALEAVAPRLSRGERAQATHVLGRFFIERDAARGRALLWRSIEEAEAPGLEEDPPARRARAYSFTSLLMEAGRRGDFEEALKLLTRERRQELPRQCLLATTVDSERTLLLARGASGELVGRYEDTRRQRLPGRLDKLVPEPLLAHLRSCERVDVLARPPLHGRAELLPPGLAWSYLTRTAAPVGAGTGAKIHLVVSDVELPSDAPFERLGPWPLAFGTDERQVILSGVRATPSNVLEEMRHATEIDLATHGVINDRSNTSYLLLAAEKSGSELGAPRVRSTLLRGAPFVVLAACHAAHTTYALHEPLSLPAAFIEAGARGVLAATEEILYPDAAVFFNAVRERMRSGVPPAIALREERMQWLRKGKEAEWVNSVLLFE